MSSSTTKQIDFHRDNDRAIEAQLGDYLTLMKPRVMSLAVFTAFCGIILAPVPMHPFLIFCSVLAIALAAGASGAFNMIIETPIDAIMKRTSQRPTVTGVIPKSDGLVFASFIAAFSVMLLGFASNYYAAALLLFTIFYYAVIYTVWLKPYTIQNIVIGGGAGALPPVVGWMSATGHISYESLLLFLIIFLWTPPHFWALAMSMKNDYKAANIPVMPNIKGDTQTRLTILLYTVSMLITSVFTGLSQIGGWFSLVLLTVLNIYFFYRAVRLYIADGQSQDYLLEKKFFVLSIVYLFCYFIILLLQKAITHYFTPV